MRRNRSFWLALAAVCLLLPTAHGVAQGMGSGSFYGDFLWTGFVDDLEELYHMSAGFDLGYNYPLTGPWSVAAQVGARFHSDRAHHGDDIFEDPGLDLEMRTMGPADAFRIIPWTAQLWYTIPWSPMKAAPADLRLGAGIGGYSVRWQWDGDDDTPRTVSNDTFFGANATASLAFHRTDAVDFVVGANYHAISFDNLSNIDELYHVVEMRLGVSFNIDKMGKQ